MPDVNRQTGLAAADIAARLPGRELSAATASGATRDLAAEIAWRLPGCSDLEIRRALMTSARLFCDRTGHETPPPGVDEIPDEIAERYADAICSGALATLCAEANKPWSDPATAAQEGQRFNAAVGHERYRRETMDGRIPPHIATRSRIPFLI